MKFSAAFVFLFLVSGVSYASLSYRCVPTGRDVDTSFFSVVTLDGQNAVVENYYNNVVAGEVARESAAEYQVGDARGGRSRIANYLVLSVVRELEGRVANPVYLEPVLLEGGRSLSGGDMGGYMAVLGQGNVYEWKVCVRQ